MDGNPYCEGCILARECDGMPCPAEYAWKRDKVGEYQKMRLKAFISQPMKGREPSEIKGEREKIIEKLDKTFSAIIDPIDSYSEKYEPKGNNVALKYLASSLELLADSDVVYFAKGWNNARGCRIEHECARAYGIMIIEEGE